MEKVVKQVSARRLRLGVLFLVIFWLPIYLLDPILISIFGASSNPSERHTITICIIAFQTVLGVLGLLLAGKPVVLMFKKVGMRKLPKTAWRILWTGKIEEIAS